MIRFLFLLLFVSSCTFKKDVVYINNIKDLSSKNINSSILDRTIQVNDILKIDVSSTIVDAALLYNKVSSLGQINSVELLKLEGYTVSDKYVIDFPVLGFLDLKNKTISEIQNEITNKLRDNGHLNDPKVNVRLLNNKFTVIGEVRNPGTFSSLENNISIFQAIGYAGDLTSEAKRNKVQLIREYNGKRSVSILDLTSKELLQDSNFYLYSNDVIIVPPNFNKIKSSGFIGSPQSITSVSSLLLSITTLILLNKN
mgnify:CR=1 FL=1